MNQKMTPPSGRLALGKRELAKKLGISVDTLERSIGRGDIKTVRVFPGRVLIPLSEINRVLKV